MFNLFYSYLIIIQNTIVPSQQNDAIHYTF